MTLAGAILPALIGLPIAVDHLIVQSTGRLEGHDRLRFRSVRCSGRCPAATSGAPLHTEAAEAADRHITRSPQSGDDLGQDDVDQLPGLARRDPWCMSGYLCSQLLAGNSLTMSRHRMGG